MVGRPGPPSCLGLHPFSFLLRILALIAQGLHNGLLDGLPQLRHRPLAVCFLCHFNCRDIGLSTIPLYWNEPIPRTPFHDTGPIPSTEEFHAIATLARQLSNVNRIP